MFNKDKSVKGIVEDASATIIEESTSVVLQNLPTIAAEAGKIIGNKAVSTTIQMLAGGVLGAIAPGAFSMGLTFQQKRFERNVTKLLKELIVHTTLLEERLNDMDTEVREKFTKGSYRDVLLDNIVSENQEQKVQDNINGFINLMSVDNPNDDIVFTFFNTLSQMNELDIKVLRIYRPDFERPDNVVGDNCFTIMKSEGIDEQQYNFIREKLARLGMISSKNEERREKNLDKIGDTLTEFMKQIESKNPKIVKPPKLEKISHSDNYSITRLGRQFLQFIDNPE